LVSRKHAQLTLTSSGGSQWRITDMDSKFGLFVNTNRIRSCNLRHDDIIALGIAGGCANIDFGDAAPDDAKFGMSCLALSLRVH
jgi:hypothetical protein